MTKREFYEAVINANMNEEMTNFANAELERMDAQNVKRREVEAEKRATKEAERAPIREAIVAVITDEPKTATTLIDEAGVEIKPQAIPHLLRDLVLNGTIEKATVKVEGKGKYVGYKRA